MSLKWNVLFVEPLQSARLAFAAQLAVLESHFRVGGCWRPLVLQEVAGPDKNVMYDAGTHCWEGEGLYPDAMSCFVPERTVVLPPRMCRFLIDNLGERAPLVDTHAVHVARVLSTTPALRYEPCVEMTINIRLRLMEIFDKFSDAVSEMNSQLLMVSSKISWSVVAEVTRADGAIFLVTKGGVVTADNDDFSVLHYPAVNFQSRSVSVPPVANKLLPFAEKLHAGDVVHLYLVED